MVDMPELDQRLVEALVRAAGAKRDRSIQVMERATGGTRIVAVVRRRLGERFVGIGERLGGAQTGQAADPATR